MHGSTGGRWKRRGLTVDGPVAYRACLGGSEKPPAPSELPPPRQRSTLPPPRLRASSLDSPLTSRWGHPSKQCHCLPAIASNNRSVRAKPLAQLPKDCRGQLTLNSPGQAVSLTD